MRGSSPHMRGTLGLPKAITAIRGIIPAYAGNTLRQKFLDMPQWDHPRICGEHSPFSTIFTVAMGSSPHMRGTRSARIAAARGTGIIPAYAGNTCDERQSD